LHRHTKAMQIKDPEGLKQENHMPKFVRTGMVSHKLSSKKGAGVKVELSPQKQKAAIITF